ncbi:hypothetical protein B4Q13_21480, partial [Lacticaseibacillus rhamnosus]
AIYIVPRRLGRISLRLPRPRPLGAQIYFIGATNVPFERLDPALTRPGRMGRHVWFRTPTKEDRKDIFDLYLDKVSHDADLDTPERRDEIARITGRPCKFRLDRDDDMSLTGKRHDFRVDYSAGFDATGRLSAVDADLLARCGYSADLSLGVNDRTMFHADNAYFYPAVRIHSRRLKTNTVSNTAFRGFGGPQGILFA